MTISLAVPMRLGSAGVSPSATWTTRRVYVTYRNMLTGNMEAGTWSASISGRITNTLANGTRQVFRSGTIGQGALNTTEGSPSLDVTVPCVDDPDNSPQGGQIVLTFFFTAGGAETYRLTPLLSWPVGGTDLSTYVAGNDGVFVQPTGPEAVTGLAVGTPTAVTMPLTWNASTGATSYLVEYKTIIGNWTTATTTATTAATVTGLTASTTYSFRVTGISNSVPGPSAQITATTDEAGVSATDNFNRANGTLGTAWTAATEGALAINGNQVTGAAGLTTGARRTAETFSGDQWSQFTVTSTAITVQDWIGAAVRMQSDGVSMYLGIYYWNNGGGAQQLILYKKTGVGAFSQLASVTCGQLAVGTVLRVTAVGNTITMSQDGVLKLSATDTALTGGVPGLMAFGATTADNWAGHDTGFNAAYASVDSNGVQSYDMISTNNGGGAQKIRVLTPTSPAPGMAHHFLISMPVELGVDGTTYGNGLDTLRSLGVHNTYNLTIVEPSFAIDPWYADHATDPHLKYETFMVQELVPWIKKTLPTTGTEQVWLIGFSKSGLGVQALILKNPSTFTLAASWDFPADMATYNGLGSNPAANYGTDANYQSNYRLTSSFVTARKTPFVAAKRLWVGGYSLYQTDVSDYSGILTAQGIQYSAETPTSTTHSWTSGWVPGAVAALQQESVNL